ncbi:hypothetical protein [Bradyrhizobium sp. I71]|uniref:hypothetical protein n=1 Tax=Bradyrhizobium sp. I71 TaxID=2590772 RepID=UPI001EF915C9|nr:hypothetical protein [Bradyrhizobium sp. I71]ULL01230.1 hypothetical protein FJV43_16400 [Bradyrhizobium sp. I71]
MPSEKTLVIDYLWDLLAEEGQGRRVVDRDDVVQAITHCNAQFGLKLSTGNPANFMKDVVRGDNASDHWPPRLTSMRIGARQRPSGRRVFEFVDFLEGQNEPFPNRYMPDPSLPVLPIEAVSLSLAKRSLGRQDESWLVQVAVELRIIQTHLATHSKQDVEEVSHLQTGVKLGSSEIDSLFLAHLRDHDGTLTKALVTCEAKQEGQRILDHQIIEQVVAASRSVRLAGIDISLIIPLAIKAMDGSRIYIAEFEPWTIAMSDLPEDQLPGLNLASEALYNLIPPVPGIGHKNPKRPRRNRQIPLTDN